MVLGFASYQLQQCEIVPRAFCCCRFVTWGVKHMKMWEYSGQREQVYRSRRCAWGGAAPQDVLCAEFLPSFLDQGISSVSKPCTVGTFLLLFHCRVSCVHVTGCTSVQNLAGGSHMTLSSLSPEISPLFYTMSAVQPSTEACSCHRLVTIG